MGASCPIGSFRDLTIQQRRRPWIRRWKIDFSSFHFFSRLFQGAQLLKRWEFSLELKRRDRAWVLTEMVEFIVLPFPFPSKLKIWWFHVLVMQGLQRNVQKSVMHVQSCCFPNQTYCFFCRSRCRPRRRCLSKNITYFGNVYHYWYSVPAASSGPRECHLFSISVYF